MDSVFALVVLALAFGLYFLPWIIALNRNRAVAPVLVVNLFFGWTLIGWAAALVWAVTECSSVERAANAEEQARRERRAARALAA